jgi:hypothetical protein
MFTEIIDDFLNDNDVVLAGPTAPAHGIEEWTANFVALMLEGYIAPAYLKLPETGRKMRPAAIAQTLCIAGLDGQAADDEPVPADVAEKIRTFVNTVTNADMVRLRQTVYDVASEALRRAFCENREADISIAKIERELAARAGSAAFQP